MRPLCFAAWRMALKIVPAEGLAFVLDGEVDERGSAAEGGGDGAGLEIVGAGGAAEGHVEVGVDIDAAGNHEAAGSVDNAPGIFDGKLGREGSDFVAVDAHVGEGSVGGGYDGAVTDYGVKAHFYSSGPIFGNTQADARGQTEVPPGLF